MSPQMFKVAQYRHEKISGRTWPPKMQADFLVCIRSVVLELFFLGRWCQQIEVWLESMTATPSVIEVPIRSSVIVWLASLLSVYLYLQ